MAKQINFSYRDNDYTLEFTRKSVERMERQGFNPNDIVDKPMLTLPQLFAGAFIANHPYLSKKITDEIFDDIANKSELISKLAEMYNEPLVSLMEDNDEGNVEWGASWD